MSSSLAKEHRAALKPFEDLYLEMDERVKGATDGELAALHAACSHVTQTNCGWPTYRVAQPVGQLVDEEIGERRRRATPRPAGTE